MNNQSVRNQALFPIGSLVRAFKFRGETTELLYVGSVIGYEGDWVQVSIITSNRGWKKGDIDVESPANLMLI